MQILKGIAVSPGVGIGEAVVVDNDGFHVPNRGIPPESVADEVSRLHKAMDDAADEIQRRKQSITRELGPQYGAIFAAHLQMLRDAQLVSEAESMILQGCRSAEYAANQTLRRFAKVFSDLGSEYMAERAQDIFDIEKLLLSKLLGQRQEELARLDTPVVVLANQLTPSDAANLDREFALGLVTETGGAGSHTAIVAEALEIPAVVGVGPFLSDVASGDMVIVDGEHGNLIIRPDASVVHRYREEKQQHRKLVVQRERLADLAAETQDGERIQLLANIEFPHEVEACLARGAEGVGLYRTEFLYLGRGNEPSEEEQFAAYRRVAESLRDRPVVIRTLDLGADKAGLGFGSGREHNPFLGLRSIRLSLRYPQMFRTQLRAILRASNKRNIQLMFPLISTLEQLQQANAELRGVMEELDDQAIPFNRDIRVGMMVEVPAAVVLLDRFVRDVDFVSIGTNDLIQYTLAVDRTNKDVAGLYTASDPAVLEMVHRSIQISLDQDTEVSLCGQMCGNPIYTMPLLGMGLRRLSVAPTALAEIKQVCRNVTLDQCQQVADRILDMDHAIEITEYLTNQLKQFAPQLAIHSS